VSIRIFAAAGWNPLYDTFNRLFAALDPLEFETCFLEWVKSVAELTEGEIISIDGKTSVAPAAKVKYQPYIWSVPGPGQITWY
jgi:hypothetical protein